jgi:hypothetical protein
MQVRFKVMSAQGLDHPKAGGLAVAVGPGAVVQLPLLVFVAFGSTILTSYGARRSQSKPPAFLDGSLAFSQCVLASISTTPVARYEPVRRVRLAVAMANRTACASPTHMGNIARKPKPTINLRRRRSPRRKNGSPKSRIGITKCRGRIRRFVGRACGVKLLGPNRSIKRLSGVGSGRSLRQPKNL